VAVAEPMTLQRRLAAHWPVIALLTLHVLLWLLVFHTIEEDAFIYLRFAENIRDGHGYVFNIGGEHVEAGTSPIWLALLTLCLLSPLSPILVIKLLSLAFSLLTILAAGRLTYALTKSEYAKLALLAMLAISYPLVFWSGQGLETPLVAFLLIANLLCMLDPAWRRWLWASCAALALVRPEAPIYLSVVALWGVWRWRSGDMPAAREALRGVLVAALLFLLGTLWRIFYFGDITAHTFYFKFEHLAVSPLHLLAAANANLRLDLFALPIIAALCMRKTKIAALWPLAAAFLLQLAWYANLSDHFAYERQLVPSLAPFFVLTVVAWWALVPVLIPEKWRRFAFGAVMALPLIALIQYRENPILLLGGVFARAPLAYAASVGGKMLHPEREAPDYVDNHLHGNVSDVGVSAFAISQNWEAQVGRFLAAAYPQDALIAYHEMGQTPYYAGTHMRFIDTVGLVDRRIGYFRFGASFARRPQARLIWQTRCAIVEFARRQPCPSLALPDAINYVLDQHPDVIMFAPFVIDAAGDRSPMRALLSDASFRELYRRTYVIDPILIYERRDRRFPLFTGAIPGVVVQITGAARRDARAARDAARVNDDTR
jgi:hypothetical protein